MNMKNFERMVHFANEPTLREHTIAYLAEHLGKFLKAGEKVMLAFREHKEGSISWLMEQAALRIDVVPVIWGPDHRWSTLLRQTFQSRASVVIGSPLILLGLTKLKKHSNTPLPIRRVVSVGFPCLDWVIDGVVKGLDCEMGGCFSVHEEGIVSGFACGHSWGVHVWEEYYDVEIVDDDGNPVPDGTVGNLILFPKSDPTVRVDLGDLAMIAETPCVCGSKTKRLLDIQIGKSMEPDLCELVLYLQSWTSILDCHLSRGESGLEIELVVFPGEKLPKLPSAAKMKIRPYDPKADEPFWFDPGVRWGEEMYHHE